MNHYSVYNPRILIFHIRKGNLNNNWYYDILLKAESQWKSFLSKDVYPYDFDEIYMLFTDRINENNTDLKDADYYFTRAMDATIVLASPSVPYPMTWMS